jgi:hypothetical protein
MIIMAPVSLRPVSFSIIKTNGDVECIHESMTYEEFKDRIRSIVKSPNETLNQVRADFLSIHPEMSIIVNENGCTLNQDFNPKATKFAQMPLVGDVIVILDQYTDEEYWEELLHDI